jgi:iron complex transport system ATP-binding protein
MDIAREAMVSAGAAQLCDRNMNTLSYGERQKVYLAMQIAQRADNCLLDEPTNFLDVSARFSLLDTLLTMRDGGRCVVCVLHDVSLALAYADRIVTLVGGKVFFDGTPEEQYMSGRLSEALGVEIERCGSTYAVLPRRDKGEL